MTDTAPRPGIADKVAAVASLLLVCGAAWAALSPPRPLSELPRGPVLERAMQRGKLIVGVRSYPRPAPPGAPTPAEPDSLDAAVAGKIAGALGVDVELVGLATSERQQALRDGRVDLLLAGAPEESDAHGIGFVPASYGAGSGMLVALRHGKTQDPAALRGLPVCVGEGSGYAGTLAKRYGAVPHSYPSAVHAVSAFMAGECAALAEDSEVLGRLLRNDEWRFYKTLARGLPPATDAAVRIADGDDASRGWLAVALRRWAADGSLAQAHAARAGNLQFEVTLLKDGLVCHS